jgi:protoporphyrinogen oxidase
MKIVILGGGLTGLASADDLRKDFDVTIFEKEGFLGGLASSFEYKGKKIPKHYHHVFFHDKITRKYLQRFGMKLKWKKIKMGVCVNKKCYNFTDPLGLLSFDYLSFFGRLRYGLFGAYVFSFMNPSKISDKEDAETWLRRVAGNEVTDKLFYYLYAKNKFNIPLSQISAKQFAHRLKAKEAKGKFGFPLKGLDSLVGGLEESIKKKGGKIFKKTKIKSVDFKKKEILVGNKKIKFDIVINTVPLPEFLKFSKNLSKDYVSKISKIKYCPAVSVVFGTKKFLSEHYWLNVLKERAGMIMQHSVLFDAYGSKVSWILRYGGSEADLGLSETEIKKAYLKVVKRYFSESEIVWSKVFKEKYASPIYDIDYFANKPDYECSVGGLYQASIAVTYPEIRNMNTALKSGLKVAGLIKRKFNR